MVNMLFIITILIILSINVHKSFMYIISTNPLAILRDGYEHPHFAQKETEVKFTR